MENVNGVKLFNMIIFFFQAEDGIRDYKVTGVQTCALPISGNKQYKKRGAAATRDLHFKKRGRCRNDKLAI